MKSTFEHYSDVIDSLIDSSDYFKVYFQNPWYTEETIYGDEFDELPDSISVTCGATRGCIVDKNSDWVVKFDVCEDEKGSACAREMNVYKAAQNAGFAPMLAEVQYLGVYTRTYEYYAYEDVDNYCGWLCYEDLIEGIHNYADKMTQHTVTVCIHLYAYRRATEHKCGERYSVAEERSARTVASPMYKRNLGVAIEFIRTYGLDVYKTFSDFLNEWEVNDLHFGNIGDIDGHLVFIDYAGYYDGFEEGLF